ncbi:MAG: VWA domain-containing protein [Euryarchaeota archaeon]|nr:VWA domain-containing protein [Euryarchaeota archaeon]
MRLLSRGEGRLEKFRRVLELYLTGIAGRSIPVRAAGEAYTNTREVFLPRDVELEGEEDALRFYKLAALHMYAQMEHSSLAGVEERLRRFANRRLAQDIFSLVEYTRLEAELTRRYRGLAREFSRLRRRLWERRRSSFREMEEREAALEALVQLSLGGRVKGELPKHVAEAVRECHSRLEEVRSPGATVRDSWRVAGEVYRMIMRLQGGYRRRPRLQLLGELKPREVKKAARQMRPGESELGVSREERSLRSRIFSFLSKGFLGSMDVNVGGGKSFSGRIDKLSKQAEYRELQRSGSSGEDAGVIPMDYSAPGSDGFIFLRRRKRGYLYPEWDYRRRKYHRDWCTVLERRVPRGDGEAVRRILEKYSGLVKLIRRRFEAMRQEAVRLRRQHDGDEVDIDAWVSCFVDIAARTSPEEKFYSRMVKRRRDVSVAFLLDQSNSTSGRTLEVEKEALVLMHQALSALGDRHAVYAFSSNTRWECNFTVVKEFGDMGIEGIAGLSPGGYTRIGAAIRHACRKLQRERSRDRVLILLTDGAPMDYDGYDGRYALEDTRMAVLEARRKGIHVVCITVDTGAGKYLPKMFGDRGYVVISSVPQLPRRLPPLYARLTAM